MSNIRTFYACQAVAVCPILESSGSYSSGTYNYMHGVQSVGLNSSFDIENLFELGQLEIYDTVLNVPEIEITIEKVLDGYYPLPLVMLLNHYHKQAKIEPP
jgi:hypothetical protein